MPRSQPPDHYFMPKFICSYGHDIACFADFVVHARSEKAALGRIRKALRDGKFENVETTPAWENGTTNERVFVLDVATDYSTDTTLKQLTAGALANVLTAANNKLKRKEK